jgi:hypothetical protein
MQNHTWFPPGCLTIQAAMEHVTVAVRDPREETRESVNTKDLLLSKGDSLFSQLHFDFFILYCHLHIPDSPPPQDD